MVFMDFVVFGIYQVFILDTKKPLPLVIMHWFNYRVKSYRQGVIVIYSKTLKLHRIQRIAPIVYLQMNPSSMSFNKPSLNRLHSHLGPMCNSQCIGIPMD
jgi:hypothetical protein